MSTYKLCCRFGSRVTKLCRVRNCFGVSRYFDVSFLVSVDYSWSDGELGFSIPRRKVLIFSLTERVCYANYIHYKVKLKTYRNVARKLICNPGESGISNYRKRGASARRMIIIIIVLESGMSVCGVCQHPLETST